ncbi:MAG: DUF1273 domain-containing protein [Ruminococcaceae bacterium]|nr:DUF1273 domain-containing protein [Oscillospiraceae bacterium]
MKKKTCCFTGHRVLTASPMTLERETEIYVRNLIEEGYSRFISGAALGFDTLAAETVLRLKKIYPHVMLQLALPCHEQDRYWNQAQRGRYRALLSAADETVYTADAYYPGCMLRRNRYLVDESACVLAYLERKTGGTKYTVDYAASQGIDILYLSPSSFSQLSFL